MTCDGKGASISKSNNLNVAPGGFNLRNDQYAEYARTLVKSNPDVIFSVGDTPTLAAKEANQTIPVVGFLSPNMVAMGVIRTFAPAAMSLASALCRSMASDRNY
jgi:hypothetical protein